MSACVRCGKKSLFHKTYHGLCVPCLSISYDEDHTQLEKLRDDPGIIERASLVEEISALRKAKDELILKKQSITQEVERLEKELIILADDVEMESFSLYKPKFDFIKSEQYKEQLDANREYQKEMLRSKTAASCSTKWSVDGSQSKGKKMTSDNIKLILRSFNNECDMAVNAVRFSNFDRCRERIVKSYDTLNKLGAVNAIRISSIYLDLKLEELHLAFEYQQKKQEEKEKLRELKAQQREEARIAKEIEEARKEAEKEKKHYLKALQDIASKLKSCKSDEEREALLKKQSELTTHVDSITAKLADIDYRQNNQKAGYVYIISNIGSFGEGIYKIGMTRRLEPMERVDELGDASVPFRFDVHAMIFSDDAPKLEAALHREFDKYRVNMINNRREYFRVSLDKIKRVVNENHDKTVEFIETPEAEQYRKSLLIAKNMQS